MDLSYQTLKQLGYSGYLLEDAPERVLQFGEGGFLRAFAQDFIDQMNEKAGFNGKVVIVQPRGNHPEIADTFQRQQGLYTLILRGRENGRQISRTRVISCVSRCLNPIRDWDEVCRCAENPELRFILSNTTEAGIAFDPECQFTDTPPATFPGKLTVFLHRRWELGLPGFWILPCELNDHNGDLLKNCILQYARQWQLEEEFFQWLQQENHICSTLVDRIVTGYPRAEADSLAETLGYQDALLDTGEVFASWIIEAPASLAQELPFEKAGLPIAVVADHVPYKQRKVRILNGAHTSLVLGAYLAGKDIVRQCMEDPVIRRFMEETIGKEIIPTLDLPPQQLQEFADAVVQRFNNPYIDHSLLAIALNSTAKWKARVMPTLLESVRRTGRLPQRITFSFAAYIAFYHSGQERGDHCLLGRRGADVFEIRDDQWVLDFYYAHRNDTASELVHSVIHNAQMWGRELADLDGFEEAVVQSLMRIQQLGMYAAMEELET